MTNPRLCLALLLGAGALWSQDAFLSRRPYLQNVTANSAVVLWATTQAPGDGSVVFREPGGLPSAVSSRVQAYFPEETGLSQTVYQHRAELRGLEPGKTYRYRVLLDGSDVLPFLPPDDLSFVTPGAAAFEFLVFGDSGDGGGPQRSLAELMWRERPAFILHTGDLAYQQGTFRQLEEFYLSIYWPLMRRAPVFPAPGNHDYTFHQAAAYLAIHDVPAAGVPESGRGRYYSFDWGNVHFVALDSNTPLHDALEGKGEMLAWLERDLAATRQEFRIVYFHHPPFPTANYRDDAYCRRLAAALTPMLERHGVHLVFLGHEHLYQRTKPHRGAFREGIGTRYVTTGGAGSTVYPPLTQEILDQGLGVSHYLRVSVDGRRLHVRAIGLRQETLDEFTLTAAPQLEPNGVREAAAGTAELAPGTLAAVYGADLARGDAGFGGFPLPRSLAGTSVKVDGAPVPLLFTGRNQINFQMPYAAEPGMHDLVIENAAGTATARVLVRPAAPAIFTLGSLPAALHADGRLVSTHQPGVAGEVLSLFLTGLGRPAAALQDGTAAPASPPLRAAANVRVQLAGVDCEVLFAGLAPGLAGLNQINFRMPAAVLPGAVPLRVLAGDASGNVVLLPVQ